MPKRSDIHSILILGSGPIIIGQACEFDYSGVQACKVLREHGYKIILLNSNPATIMTDPEMADITYIEPLSLEFAEKIIQKEQPDAVLPTVGGQTALNLAMELHHSGILEKYGVELLGAKPEVIDVAENRQSFKECMIQNDIPVAGSGIANTLEEALSLIDNIGLPAIIRPSFTLGGHGGGIAYDLDEYKKIITRGLDLSPISQVLVEKSALGWKEFEFEVMRDKADNVIIVCAIENFDPMGVHTGDSITVAPAQTLTDKEYQHLRDLSLKIMRCVGVETGGSNIQFSVNPENGDCFVIEMNPRVSRSSALASKATGFPIAKIAALLAVGMTLDEIPNDITKKTPACFEPALDYVVVKIPRWNFEKFPNTPNILGTQMKAVGEVMALGSSFSEAISKAMQSLEQNPLLLESWSNQRLVESLSIPTPDRLFQIFECFRRGISQKEIHSRTQIDPWFLMQLEELILFEKELALYSISSLPSDLLFFAKQMGISDQRLAQLCSGKIEDIKTKRAEENIHAVYKRVDTCAAEFESFTPYLYSTYAEEDEAGDSKTERILVLGNGPNRIGQGLEFDYCCCHAAMAVQEEDLTSVMINCNPETVSTDYDTSDKLYFEPITVEHVSSIIQREQPRGLILQFGGQTPLKLAKELGPILGTSADTIDLCEDRNRFYALLKKLNIPQPKGALVYSNDEALEIATQLGFPLLVRPSYVLGGRAMNICFNQDDFQAALQDALNVSETHPVLIDQYLEAGTEYDVDALCDGEEVYIAGIMEHIEEAGIHSGDSSCVIPPVLLSKENKAYIEEAARKIALELNIIGLVNIQFLIQNEQVYVLEVNPRASRTVPFVSKAKKLPIAKLATQICLGKKLSEILPDQPSAENLYFVKTPVFPWIQLAQKEISLSPEMKSTGEVMGIGKRFGEAYAKGLLGAKQKLSKTGNVFLSIPEKYADYTASFSKRLQALGYQIYAPKYTYNRLTALEDPSICIKTREKEFSDILEHIKDGSVQIIINIPFDAKSREDNARLRFAGMLPRIPHASSIQEATALISALEALHQEEFGVVSLQEIE